ncbi:MAG: TetR/AcrR family transcriptional regulator [Spirosomaceae bacterium]|nr:TetR/AcrR family transcriptional regulator [Spirosomataceae bacterium]
MGKAAETRKILLQKAFELIYINGYQATSVDDILATTNVTKGAFYYHFKNKEEMGLAVIKELMHDTMQSQMIEPMLSAPNPLDIIYKIMHDLLLETPFLQIKYGCPTHNLIQEMAPLNENFREALLEVMASTQKKFETALKNAIDNRTIKTTTNVKQVANFIITGYAGIRNIGKLYTSDECYHLYLNELKSYLNSLRT